VRRESNLMAAAIAAVVLGAAHLAAAQAPPPVAPVERTAEENYNRGRDLMKSGRYQDAAGAFEVSQKLDPGWGTLYNLAQCYEHIGKLASAQAIYRDLARADSYPRGPSVPPERDRAGRKDAGKRADALDKRVPKLRLTLAAPPPGLVVTLDGSDATRLVGSDRPVDLGAHKIHATAPGHSDFETTATITDEARTVSVAIELSATAAVPVADVRGLPPGGSAAEGRRGSIDTPVAAIDGAAPVMVPPPEPPAVSRSSRKTYGVVVAAGGGVLVATGLVFGQLASSKWKDAQDACENKICADAAALNAGVVSDARSRATASTVLVIGGAVAVAAGAVLYLTAPRARATSAWRVTPSAGASGLAVTLDGRF
jgi:drug/metabolite transporter superfamily protein YnfA